MGWELICLAIDCFYLYHAMRFFKNSMFAQQYRWAAFFVTYQLMFLWFIIDLIIRISNGM